MPSVIEQFGKLSTAALIAELGGFMFAPSVLIKCLMSAVGSATFDRDVVQNLTLRAEDFCLRTYINEVDRDIVLDNLRGQRIGNCIDDADYSLASQVLESIVLLPFNSDIEAHAHEISSKMPFYDARRLVSASQHDVSLVTCEPLHFTRCPLERDHIERFGYADVSIGKSESDEGLIDSKVWIFSPESLSLLLRNRAELQRTDRVEILSLVNYETSSNLRRSTAKVELCLNGEIIKGTATDQGAIDVLLRATEKAVQPYIELTSKNVHLQMSDTTANNDIVQICLRLNLNGCRFEATVEGDNALECSLRAYIKAINAALKKWH